MPWYLHFLVPISILGIVFLTLHLMTRLGGVRGQAPGWQVRCTRCDHTRDAGEAGIFRIGAASAGKRVLGYCRHCRGVRWIALERKPELL